MKKLTVGSRESKLAVIQANIIIEQIKAFSPDLEIELITMKTTGDKILDQSLDKIGGKGLFVKELDNALYRGEIDIAVHSLKDMPAQTDERLPILAYSKRENPADCLVLSKGVETLDVSKPIGSSSARRKMQIESLYPTAQTNSIRGNVLTRLQKLDEGQFGALVLASAGLIRLGLTDRISKIFSTDEMIPSAGQGILAIQGRKGEAYDFIPVINDMVSAVSARAERAFIDALGCGCTAPVAAYAEVLGEELRLKGLYLDEQTGRRAYGVLCGSLKEAEDLGKRLAERLQKEVTE